MQIILKQVLNPHVDVRASTPEEQARVDAAFQRVSATVRSSPSVTVWASPSARLGRFSTANRARQLFSTRRRKGNLLVALRSWIAGTRAQAAGILQSRAAGALGGRGGEA